MFNKKIAGEILSLLIPIIGEMLIYTFMWEIDLIMVGQYAGNIGLSTVGICDEIIYTCTDTFIAAGISIGIASLISRSIGGKHLVDAEKYAAAGFFLGTIVSFIISYILYTFCDKILIFAGAQNDVLHFGINYMRISTPGIFFNMMTNILCSTLRGYGNTSIPMFTALVVSSLKIILDWILIFGKLGIKELGINGCAGATTLSGALGFMLIMFYALYYSQVKLKFKYIIGLNLRKFRHLLNLSIPASFQEGSFSLSRLLSNFIIMYTGTKAFAANQIANTIESVSFMPGIGLGLAATTLIGLRMGEKNYRLAKKYAYVCTFLAILMMSLCSIIFLVLPDSLVSIFVKKEESEVLYLSKTCLMIASVEQPFMAVSMVLGGALKGLGDTKSPFVVSVISSWFVRLPLMFYFIYINKCPVTYVWWITALQWFLDSILMAAAFKSKFKKSRGLSKNL